MLGPGLRDVIAVPGNFAGGQERNRARLERTLELVGDWDALVAEDARELVVMALGGLRIGADEEGGAVLDDPPRELVHFAVERVEQDQTDHAVAQSSDLKAV